LGVDLRRGLGQVPGGQQRRIPTVGLYVEVGVVCPVHAEQVASGGMGGEVGSLDGLGDVAPVHVHPARKQGGVVQIGQPRAAFAQQRQLGPIAAVGDRLRL